jgi:hypothetical protein
VRNITSAQFILFNQASFYLRQHLTHIHSKIYIDLPWSRARWNTGNQILIHHDHDTDNTPIMGFLVTACEAYSKTFVPASATLESPLVVMEENGGQTDIYIYI